MTLIIDAHQDIAWNMLTFGRDYTQSVAETRRVEAHSWVVEANEDTLLGWPEYQQGNVAVIFSTLFAAPERAKFGEWETECYKNSAEAHKKYKKQIEVYRRLCDEHHDKFRLIGRLRDLDEVLTGWQQPASKTGNPVGLVPLMEGGDGIRSMDELEMWWDFGVRIIGPAWRSTRFCGGTMEPGPLTKDGHALLETMQGLGFALDISHMDELAAHQALDRYEGPVIASHANPLKMLKGSDSNRHLSDRVLDQLFERGGVTGIVPLNVFLKHTWNRKTDPRSDVPLSIVVDHIDYICQRAGNAQHVGIGSDFDGGFGLQRTPEGIDTVADLQKLAPMLAARGYNEEDIAAILGGNWLSFLRRALPS